MYDEQMQEIFDKMKIFEKAYEVIRFVDPLYKRVIKYKSNTVTEMDVRCFDFWGRSKVCDNCISIRALNESETFVKFEYSRDNIYLITAIPFELDNRRIVIELMKDATNSLVFGSSEGCNGSKSEIHAMIDRMNSLAMKDALTGVYNRRYINEKLPIDMINAELLGQDLSIILADIDFFKQINDTYGHLAGDRALKGFAETLNECVNRKSDWIARFGGEEFLICLPSANLEKAVEIAELMRNRVEEKEISFEKDVLKITASFGVCSMKSKQGESIELLIQRADSKLYSAKSKGRNRIDY
jgi:two-component system, cell cycle response regulator